MGSVRGGSGTGLSCQSKELVSRVDERVNRLSQHRGRTRKRRGSELRGRDSQIAGQGSVDNTGGRAGQRHTPESKLQSFGVMPAAHIDTQAVCFKRSPRAWLVLM